MKLQKLKSRPYSPILGNRGRALKNIRKRHKTAKLHIKVSRNIRQALLISQRGRAEELGKRNVVSRGIKLTEKH